MMGRLSQRVPEIVDAKTGMNNDTLNVVHNSEQRYMGVRSLFF